MAGVEGVLEPVVDRQSPEMAKESSRTSGEAGLLEHDPVPPLLATGDPAILTFARRDLLGEPVELRTLWELPEPRRLLRRQQDDGSWRYRVAKPPPLNYDLYETFNVLGTLVSKYGFDRHHPATEKAASYAFSSQTAQGDFRGIYGRQPAHTYTAALTAALIDAGYESHPSIERAFDWLLDTRQDDGGWALPARTRGERWDIDRKVEADTSKPFSHTVTGMVLRALAAHPKHQASSVASRAGELVASRFFQPDKYPDRRGREFWTRFTYPFGYTDLLTALDSLGRIGFDRTHPHVAQAIEWFRDRQTTDGSFDLATRRGESDKSLSSWLDLAVCRALARFGPLYAA